MRASVRGECFHGSRRRRRCSTAARLTVHSGVENIRNLSQRQKSPRAPLWPSPLRWWLASCWSRQPDYAVLFSNSPRRDGAPWWPASSSNIPWLLSGNGNAIPVPAATTCMTCVPAPRRRPGHPQGRAGASGAGEPEAGPSQFHEQVSTTSAPSKARVVAHHLGDGQRGWRPGASGHPSSRPPSCATSRSFTASVMVTRTPAAPRPGQIAGIVHLIASSVPNLTNDNVSVDRPDVPCSPRSWTCCAPTRRHPDQIHSRAEEGYIERINAILTPLFGRQLPPRCRPTWISTSPSRPPKPIAPTPSPEQAIRSQQSNESTTREQVAQACRARSPTTSCRCRPPRRSPPTWPVGGAAGFNQQPPQHHQERHHQLRGGCDHPAHLGAGPDPPAVGGGGPQREGREGQERRRQAGAAHG